MQPPIHPGDAHHVGAGLPHLDGELSGPEWVARFPTSQSIDDLAEPFRTNVKRFIGALQAAGASVQVEATRRPPERAYLMHYAFLIAREHYDPIRVPPMAGVNIQWVHRDGQGRPDLTASRRAAEQMVRGYDIVYEPALNSRHEQGLAIDMSIRWPHNLIILDGNGRRVRITSMPHTGAGNTDLQAVGVSYSVYKLRTDPPHWSSDGH